MLRVVSEKGFIDVDLGVGSCRIRPISYRNSRGDNLLKPHLVQTPNGLFLNVPFSLEDDVHPSFRHYPVDTIVCGPDSYTQVDSKFTSLNSRVVGVYSHLQTFPVAFSPFTLDKSQGLIKQSFLRPYEEVTLVYYQPGVYGMQRLYFGRTIPIDGLPGHFYVLGSELNEEQVLDFIRKRLIAERSHTL